MADGAKDARSTIIPALRYRDAKAAIRWLCDVFGFAEHAVYEAADGSIAHAQLSFGNGMVMLGSVADNEYSRNICQPDEVGRKETQAPYLLVADADAVYSRAKAAGFEIVVDIKDEDYGGRGFSCRDPEGHLWNVGTYDPWAPRDS